MEKSQDREDGFGYQGCESTSSRQPEVFGYRMWYANFALSQNRQISGFNCNIFEYDTVLKGNNLPIVWRERERAMSEKTAAQFTYDTFGTLAPSMSRFFVDTLCTRD